MRQADVEQLIPHTEVKQSMEERITAHKAYFLQKS